MNRSRRGVFVPGLVVILCVASGYTEVFGKIKAAPPADKRKDKTSEGLRSWWLAQLSNAARSRPPTTTQGGDLFEPAGRSPGGMDNAGRNRFWTREQARSPAEPCLLKGPCVLPAHLPAGARLSVPYHMPSNLILLKNKNEKKFYGCGL